MNRALRFAGLTILGAIVVTLILFSNPAPAEAPVKVAQPTQVRVPTRVLRDPPTTTSTSTTTTTTIVPVVTTTVPKRKEVARSPRGNGDFFACVRAHESDTAGGYSAQNPTSTASGAYQILNSTWGNFMGYPTAASAPPWVQDLRASQLPRSAWHGSGCAGT